MSETSAENIANRRGFVFFLTSLIVYAGVCGYLYYNQLLNPITGMFEADTPVHVSMAVNDGFCYSLLSYVYVLCAKVSFGNILIASMLALFTAGAVYITYIMLDKATLLAGFGLSDGLLFVSAYLLNFVMAFYVSAVNPQHYIGYQSANMWHNSTYIGMRFFAIAVLCVYADIYREEKPCIKDLIVFAVLFAVSTLIKPSFTIVFGPVFVMELLYDFLAKKHKFTHVLFKGLAAVPALISMFAVSTVMFGGETGNGYAIRPFYELSRRGTHPKVTLVLSILFPLAVFMLHIKDFYKDRIYSFSLLMWLVGFLEVFLMAETGDRSGDGNFFWGYSIALFVAFAGALYMIFKDLFANAMLPGKVAIAVRALLLGIFAWHAIGGIWYFTLLLTGVTYFV